MKYLDIKELADELDELREAKEAGEEHDADRLVTLEKFERDANSDLHIFARNCPTLIPEEEFKDYARELAEDFGAKLSDWPHNCIDWEQAASELRGDYSEIEFDGDTYLYQ